MATRSTSEGHDGTTTVAVPAVTCASSCPRSSCFCECSMRVVECVCASTRRLPNVRQKRTSTSSARWHRSERQARWRCGRTEDMGMQASAGGEHGRCERRRCERAGECKRGHWPGMEHCMDPLLDIPLCCMDPMLHGPSVSGPCISPCFGTDRVRCCRCSA